MDHDGSQFKQIVRIYLLLDVPGLRLGIFWARTMKPACDVFPAVLERQVSPFGRKGDPEWSQSSELLPVLILVAFNIDFDAVW